MISHDKLVTSLTRTEEYTPITKYRAYELVGALLSAVELHSPTPENRYPKLLCQGCSMTEVNLYVEYPCPTIQVIERELSKADERPSS